MVTTEKILQTMNSWQSGEVIAVHRKKCSGASSPPTEYRLCMWILFILAIAKLGHGDKTRLNIFDWKTAWMLTTEIWIDSLEVDLENADMWWHLGRDTSPYLCDARWYGGGATSGSVTSPPPPPHPRLNNKSTAHLLSDLSRHRIANQRSIKKLQLNVNNAKQSILI